MEWCASLYAQLASIVPGSTSVNELRVLTAIGLATLKDEHIGISELARELKLPLSSTSRLVARLRGAGVVTSVKHPLDDRRRSLQVSTKHMASLSKWAKIWVADQE
jgi:DNA-binding MarR family transcriptional regulator